MEVKKKTLKKMLGVAACAGEQLGGMGFFEAKITKGGVVFPNYPNWGEKWIVRWDGSEEKLPARKGGGR